MKKGIVLALVCVILIMLARLAQAQVSASYQLPDWQKVTPPSADIASLAVYGETPVGLYTGTPNINIPIYEVTCGRIKLPITLSYAAKGIKVEEIASLVGLGWSLNAGGIISRTVHGKQDEEGYMTDTNGKMRDLVGIWPSSPSSNSNWMPGMPVPSWLPAFETVIRSIASGAVDGEADMFYYNFGNYSGKFFYTEDQEELVSIPMNNIQFNRDYFLANGNVWHVLTPDGIRYEFENKEMTYSKSACDGIASTDRYLLTGWYLTKISDPSTNATINLNYQSVHYNSENISSYAINQSDGGSISACVKPRTICNSDNTYDTFRLTSITYDNGRIEFISNTDRCDLPGTKALDSIKIYSSGPKPFVSYRFEYEYFNKDDMTCNSNDKYTARLKLKALRKISADGHEQPPYTFIYDELHDLPSRMSYNQDAWGYFNHSNNDFDEFGMVPPWVDHAGNEWEGANRVVDTVFTRAATLLKIIYPTGGNTEYTYENHRTPMRVEFATNQDFHSRNVQLYQTDYGQKVFIKKVFVNNELRPNAYVDITISTTKCYDCNQSLPPLTTCSQISLDPIDGGPSIILRCSENHKSIPNGVYFLKADFSGAPDSTYYDGFYMNMNWIEYQFPDSVQRDYIIGGLRIKKITDDDGFGNLKMREYQYSDGYLSYDRFGSVYDLGCYGSAPNPPFVLFHVRQANSSIPLGGSPGSTFGYATVIEQRTGNKGPLGKTVYNYSNARIFPDDIVANYPYGEPISFDHRRGLLLKQEDFAWENSSFKLIRSVENEYKPLDMGYGNWQDPYLGNNDPRYRETLSVRTCYLDLGSPGAYPYPLRYKTLTEWVRQTKSTERIYDGALYTEKLTQYEYGNPAHQQPTKITETGSDGTQTATILKYPLDYGTSTNFYGLTSWSQIQALQNKNHVNEIILKVNTRRSISNVDEIVAGSFVGYNSIQLPSAVYALELDKPKPATETQQILLSPDYKPKLFFEYELEKGQLIQQQKSSDISNSYIWGYGNSLLVAEAINANRAQIFHTSFEDTDYGSLGTIGAAVTGERYYSGSSYTIPLQYQPTGSGLKMTYWYYKNSQWNFKSETNYTPTISEAGATAYDEIRVYPPNAMMTTYCYEPGVGVLSVMDVNNRITTYEYDGFGRLVVVRDNNKKILKAFQYHYKNETTGN